MLVTSDKLIFAIVLLFYSIFFFKIKGGSIDSRRVSNANHGIYTSV